MLNYDRKELVNSVPVSAPRLLRGRLSAGIVGSRISAVRVGGLSVCRVLIDRIAVVRRFGLVRIIGLISALGILPDRGSAFAPHGIHDHDQAGDADHDPEYRE